jgi:hypothetical protein
LPVEIDGAADASLRGQASGGVIDVSGTRAETNAWHRIDILGSNFKT